MSARDEGRMGRNPLEPPEAESYAEAVIPRQPAAASPEERIEGRKSSSPRRWTPRPKHPDDPDDRSRHSYYVGDWVHNRLKALARKHRVPVSDLARYLLRDGIERLENEELQLETRSVVAKKLR